ncbi:MAG TPA: hypothetical protein PKD10_01115 [Paracoccaceae bacterium]|nr:hypothetical protein [Paracoccaceae bacterium]HMO71426.1 hypothetical protein [Paracoccaceae bacterium]
MTRPLTLVGALVASAMLALPAAAQTGPAKESRGNVTLSAQGVPLVFGALGGVKVAAGVIAPVLLLGAMSNSGSH